MSSTPPTLHTPRLRLRNWRDDDLPAVIAIKTDPANWQFIGDGTPQTPASAARVVDAFQREWLVGGIGRWAVEQVATRELIGDCGIVGSERGPQLAYMIARSKWGTGFATEAARSVLAYAFAGFDWPAVFASAHAENAASRRVLDKLGMRHADTIETPLGAECWYELTRESRTSIE